MFSKNAEEFLEEDEWMTSDSPGDVPVPESILLDPLLRGVSINLVHETRVSLESEGLMPSSIDGFADSVMFYRELGQPEVTSKAMAFPTERVVMSISVPGLVSVTTFISYGPPLTDGFVKLDKLPLAIRTELRNAIARREG